MKWLKIIPLQETLIWLHKKEAQRILKEPEKKKKMISIAGTYSRLTIAGTYSRLTK